MNTPRIMPSLGMLSNHRGYVIFGATLIGARGDLAASARTLVRAFVPGRIAAAHHITTPCSRAMRGPPSTLGNREDLYSSVPRSKGPIFYEEFYEEKEGFLSRDDTGELKMRTACHT